jgi:predicted small metal-binding protein
MSRQIRCECGYIARGATDDEVVGRIREHMRTDHPALFEKISEEEVHGWVEIVD